MVIGLHSVRNVAHELGHAAGLVHIWEPGSSASNTKENKNNLLNTDENPVETNRSHDGKELTKDQSKIIKTAVEKNEKKVKKDENKN